MPRCGYCLNRIKCLREQQAVIVGVRGVLQAFAQFADAPALHAAVGKTRVALLAMLRVIHPRGNAVGGSARTGQTGRVDANPTSPRCIVVSGLADAHCVIAHQQHLWLGFVGIDANEIAHITAIGKSNARSRGNAGCEGRCHRAATVILRRARENLWGVQLVRHHGEHLMHILAPGTSGVVCPATCNRASLSSGWSPRTTGAGGYGHGITVTVINRPLAEGKTVLLEIVGAANALRLGFRLGQRGKQHRRENRDDRDHNEQLDERKGSEMFTDVIHNSLTFGFLLFG